LPLAAVGVGVAVFDALTVGWLLAGGGVVLAVGGSVVGVGSVGVVLLLATVAVFGGGKGVDAAGGGAAAEVVGAALDGVLVEAGAVGTPVLVGAGVAADAVDAGVAGVDCTTVVLEGVAGAPDRFGAGTALRGKLVAGDGAAVGVGEGPEGSGKAATVVGTAAEGAITVARTIGPALTVGAMVAAGVAAACPAAVLSACAAAAIRATEAGVGGWLETMTACNWLPAAWT
jgi:hypothetical protein